MDILLDTNILLSIFEIKLDILRLIDEEFGVGKYFTLPQVIGELQQMRSKESVMALQLARRIPLKAYESTKPVDDALIDYCEANSCMLATQDVELQQKAKSKHLKVVGIRQQRYLNLMRA